jgi:hypothetical protein
MATSHALTSTDDGGTDALDPHLSLSPPLPIPTPTTPSSVVVTTILPLTESTSTVPVSSPSSSSTVTVSSPLSSSGRHWLTCFALVKFDIDLGPSLAYAYPPNQLMDNEITNGIARYYCARHDCSCSYISTCTFD